MDNLSVYFLLSDDGFEMNFSPGNEKTWDVYIEFLAIFGDLKESNLNVSPAQVASLELKRRLWSFIDKYKTEVPVLNKLKNKIDSVENNKYFLILPSKPDDTQKILDLELYLQALNSTNNSSEVQGLFSQKRDEFNGLFENLLQEYNLVNIRNDRRTYVGQSEKSKRVCRFCKKSEKDGVTFRKVAHAISEGLGNKSIILYEECDGCNEYFGSAIEPSLVENLDIARVFFGVKGKGGVPSIGKYKDSKVFRSDNGSVIQTPKIDVISGREITVTLVSHKKYVPINIYKALCKIALSVVDQKEIEYLDDTISWLKSCEPGSDAPKVAVNLDRGAITSFPSITLYVRKTENYNYPHIVGEFKAAGFVYIFIVPHSRKDKKSFFKEEEFNSFWKFFPQYSSSNDWRFDDYNNSNEVEITEKLRFVQNDKDQA